MFHCSSNVVDFYVMWNSECFVVGIMHSNECIIFLENEVSIIFVFMVVFIFITLSLSCGNWGEELIYSNLVFVGIVMMGFFIFLFRKVVILGQ